MTDQMLLDDAQILEIAMRCWRGWFRADVPRAAMSESWQRSRLENYKRVIAIAPRYVRDRDGMSRDCRNAIWAHVCAETDLAWKASG